MDERIKALEVNEILNSIYSILREIECSRAYDMKKIQIELGIDVYIIIDEFMELYSPIFRKGNLNQSKPTLFGHTVVINYSETEKI